MGLSRDHIARTAILLIERDGLDKLSMRKLGQALDVKAMSLYNHVRNKSDLLDAVHEQLLSGLKIPELRGDWRESVRETASSFLKLLQAHPGLIPLFATRSAIAPGSLRTLDASLGLLVTAGFSAKEGLMIFQSIFALVIGHAVYHYGRRDPDSYSAGAGYQEYPHLAQLSQQMDYPPDEEFDFGLEHLLTGLEGRLRGR